MATCIADCVPLTLAPVLDVRNKPLNGSDDTTQAPPGDDGAFLTTFLNLTFGKVADKKFSKMTHNTLVTMP